MNKHPAIKNLSAAKAAIMSGDADSAAIQVDALLDLLKENKAPQHMHSLIEGKLQDLRRVAEAALSGTRMAAEEVQTINLIARSVQTYDSHGNKNVETVASRPARRF